MGVLDDPRGPVKGPSGWTGRGWMDRKVGENVESWGVGGECGRRRRGIESCGLWYIEATIDDDHEAGWSLCVWDVPRPRGSKNRGKGL